MPQTVLITGASKGIGLALARVFAREKHNLILVARSQDQLQALQTELSEKYAVEVTLFSYDLTEPGTIQRLFEQIQQQSLTVDILVNNAGYGDYGEFAHSDWEKIQGMILLNVLAVSHLSRLFLPGMIERGYGKVLNLGSTASFQPGPMMAVYFASKAYILSFSEALAAETEGTGVTVTVLCPGPTQSNFGQVANMDEIALMGDVTSDKLPTAEEVAEYGYESLQSGQVIAVHGWLNKALTFAPRFTPRKVIREGVKKFMTPEKKK